MKNQKSGAPYNVKVIAVSDGTPEFNIFLDFSGQREPLVHRRSGSLLYSLLKDGVRLEELRRFEPFGASARSPEIRSKQRHHTRRLENTVSHLLGEIDGYLFNRAAAPASSGTGVPKGIEWVA